MDLLDKQVVRLEQGDYRRATAYSDVPLEIARNFAKYDAQKIHLVDLNAAIHQDPTTNAQIIDGLLREVGRSIDFEVAGGIRTVSLAKSLVERGAKNVVIGSIAYSVPKV